MVDTNVCLNCGGNLTGSGFMCACGVRDEYEKIVLRQKSTERKWAAIFLTLVAAAGVSAYFWYMQPHKVAYREHQALIERQAEMEDDAESNAMLIVQSRLRDAGSARFQNLRTRRGMNGEITVCGEVNANNAFGAKAGFEKFMVVGSGSVFESEGATDFYQRWATVC